MDNTTKWVRVFAAVICVMVVVWSLFGMFVVPYYTAMEFPLIRKDFGSKYEQRVAPPEARMARLRWQLD